MDAHELSHAHSISLEESQANRGAVHQAELLEMQCMVCRRTFIPWIEVNEGIDPLGICRECKSFVLDDNEIGLAARNSWGRHRRVRSIYGSSESAESFSQMIGLARQNRDPELDDETTTAIHRRPNHTHRSWPRRARRVSSDTDNDSVERMDSLIGDTDSHISFGGYGGDSDASLDAHSMIERELLSPMDDTDIDPMHAGLDQWTSDEQGEYGAWEEVNVIEASMRFMEPHGRIWDANSPNGSSASPQNGVGVRPRVRPIDLFTDTDEIDLSPFTGNSGDYMDAQGFEELLEQLADEADSLRRGAPPASASSLRNLLCVIISKDHEKNGGLVCAICKDPLSVDAEARQLPCSHLYHPSCILPWLRTRNSCPVCRYELPTDDPEYEEGKHSNVRNVVVDEIRQPVIENYSDESSDVGDEADEHDQQHTEIQPDVNGDDDDGAKGGSRHRWLLIAGAPIVTTIVGVVIAMWLRNSMAGGRRIHCGVRDHDTQEFHGRMARASRSRRWWSLF